MADCLPSLFTEIGKCIWDSFLNHHVDYWWCFDDNIQQLRDRIQDLERLKYDIQQRIERARENAEILRPGVQEWFNSSIHKLEEARTTLANDNTPEAWKLISRYSLGKTAKETAKEIAKHLNNGKFDLIADPAPSAAMASPPHTSNMDFESRKDIEEAIIKFLKESSVDVIGICGMGGVGKTTMARRIWKMVKDGNLFDEVVMVTVSQKIDMPKIQSEIADLLKLKFDESSMPARAHQLRTRLMDTKKKLIILDDVWESLDFQDLGIPIDSNFERCRLLLTSRLSDTCNTITSKMVFELKTLEEEEAWNLFREKAGTFNEDSALWHLAKEVVKECKGLPIALVTVGQALQGQRDIRAWKNSLLQLKKSNPLDLPKVIKKVYQPLKLSYDKLDTDVEKCFFLLCCLFPEDYHIPIEHLTWYSMGLQMFDDISSIEEAVDRAHTLVGKLKSRFLVIDGEDKLHVKMHDVIRDVAIYILKSLTSIKNSSDLNCIWMSVDISNEQMDVPLLSRFPKLQLLMWSSKAFYDISHLSFEGMEDLKVLSFEDISIGLLPPTLGSLKNLHTLRLVKCEVENISVIGNLTSLKILSCYECRNIAELPAEIGSLSGLRLLELSYCSNIQRIPFGVISNLRWLEELKMRESFSRWEAEEKGKERRNANASLKELECLRNLSCLEIEIHDCTLSAQEIRLSQNLVKYYIRIGSYDDDDDYDYDYDYDYHFYFDFNEGHYEKVMILNLPSDIGAVGEWIQKLVRNTELLHLEGDGSCSNNFNIAEIEYLRNLRVAKCSTVKKLDMVFCSLETLALDQLENLEEICIIPNQNVSLSISSTNGCLKELRLAFLPKLNSLSFLKDVSLGNLKFIRIFECHKLRSLFSVSVAKTSLLQLKVLDIQHCEAMEEVFWNDGTDDNTDILFPTKDVSFGNLKSVNILDCNKLRSLFSVAKTSLLQLEDLSVSSCDAMEQVFWNEGTNDNTDGCIEFPKLKELRLADLRKLTAFCQGLENKSIKFPNLTKMDIGGLPSLKYSVFFSLSSEIPRNLKSIEIDNFSNLKHLFSGSVATTILLQLEVLSISSCDAMEQVFYGCIEFPTLKELTLHNLPNLTAFCQGLQNKSIKFPNLRKMTIRLLPKLNSVSPLNSETVVVHDHNTSLHFFCNPKVEMSCLKDLTLSKFNIRNIWCHQIPNNVFNNLKRLTINYMNCIKSLMSISMAKNLTSLKELNIYDCGELVEVIERDEDDDKQVVHFNCLFPTLIQLNMGRLPKLKKFWQWNHALELPLLEYVCIIDCRIMETFTLGSIDTPNIKRLWVNYNYHEVRIQKDLNDVLRHLWTKSQDKFKADGDGDENKNGKENENINENENENKY